MVQNTDIYNEFNYWLGNDFKDVIMTCLVYKNYNIIKHVYKYACTFNNMYELITLAEYLLF